MLGPWLLRWEIIPHLERMSRSAEQDTFIKCLHNARFEIRTMAPLLTGEIVISTEQPGEGEKLWILTRMGEMRLARWDDRQYLKKLGEEAQAQARERRMAA